MHLSLIRLLETARRQTSFAKKTSAAARFEFDIELHYTTGPGSATHIADKVAASAERDGEEVRIYACGGDGTVNEGKWCIRPCKCST